MSDTKEQKRPDTDFVKKADGTFATDKDGNRVLTKKAKQRDNDEARRAARKEAFDKLTALGRKVLDLNILDAEDNTALKSALIALKPLRSSSPMVRESIQDKLTRLFAGKKSVTGPEAYAFEGTHWGTSDMRRNMVLAIKTGEPEKRLWISYNGKEDEYLLEGVGKDAPLGWMGYVPVDVA